MTVRDAASTLASPGTGEGVTPGVESAASDVAVAVPTGTVETASRQAAVSRNAVARQHAAEQAGGQSQVQSQGQAQGRGESADVRELVRRAQAGERAAFRQLVDLHQRRVYQLALSIVRSHEDAMDVVQETFIRVHQNLPRFKGDAAFFTWVYRIARNAAIDHQRRERRVDTVEVDENTLTDEGAQHDPLAIDSPSPLKAALRGELADVLARALSSLSEAHRTILVLREVDGLSYEELAQTLAIPKGTVMSRLFHARQRMQVLLADYVERDTDRAGGKS